MGSGSLTNELIDFFHASPQMPTPSAFLQQRSKIKPEAFRSIFDGFNETITKGFSEKMPIFAVDGSDIQIATNPGDTGSYYPGSNGQKGYNLLHLNALYEIDYHIYADSIIQKSKNCNEHKALQEMVDRSTIPEALIIADRGYDLIIVWHIFRKRLVLLDTYQRWTWKYKKQPGTSKRKAF